MIPATISTMLSTTSPVTRPPKISVDNRKPPIGVRRQHLAGDRGRHHRQHLASTNYPDSVMISLRSSLEKLSAGARVIFGVAALLENTPFELYTLIRSGSARNANATMSRRTIWRSGEICRDHRVCRTRCWRESLVELRRQVHVATDEPRKDEFLAKICMSGWQVSLQRVCHLQRGRRRHSSASTLLHILHHRRASAPRPPPG